MNSDDNSERRHWENTNEVSIVLCWSVSHFEHEKHTTLIYMQLAFIYAATSFESAFCHSSSRLLCRSVVVVVTLTHREERTIGLRM